MTDIARLQRQLKAIDWDFQQPIRGVLGGLHWYPASFPASVPSSLITLLSPPGGIVFDPYSGTGAVGAESIRQGRSAVVCDVNPVAVLASWSLLALLQLRIHRHALFDDTVTFVHEWLAANGSVKRGQERLFIAMAEPQGLDVQLSRLLSPSPAGLWNKLVVAEPAWCALSHWFQDETLSSIKAFSSSMLTLQTVAVRCFLLTAQSAVMRSASSQNQSWGHIADNVLPKERVNKDFFQQMRRWWTAATNQIINCEIPNSRDESPHKPSVLYLDWTSAKPTVKKEVVECDLLLTSPPYSDAIDYLRAQRLSVYLLGYDEEALDSLAAREIGARRKRFRANSANVWADELENAIRTQIKYVQHGGYTCLILPHRQHPHSELIDKMLTSLFRSGWHRLAELERTIHQFRTRQSWTSIRKESITIFRRET